LEFLNRSLNPWEPLGTDTVITDNSIGLSLAESFDSLEPDEKGDLNECREFQESEP